MFNWSVVIPDSVTEIEEMAFRYSIFTFCVLCVFARFSSQKKSFPNLPFSQKKCVVLERCFNVLISLKINIGTSRTKSKFCHYFAEAVFIFA